MTTKSWTSPIDMSSDAAMRAWGSELNTKLTEAGLLQTVDAGQINWATVTRPGASSIIGYEIWRFNDALQSTAPIYLKLEFGTNPNGTANYPALYLTVGTGSNGAGTLTGVISTRGLCPRRQDLAPGATAYPSYLCVVSGFVGLSFKAGASGSTGFGFFAIARTCDAAGAPTATGCVVYRHGSAAGSDSVVYTQVLRFAATSGTRGVNQSSCLVIGGVSESTLSNGDKQRYVHWMDTPEVLPCFAVCTVLVGEAPLNTSFVVILVGATSRTYLSLGLSAGYGDRTASAAYGIAMLWEP